MRATLLGSTALVTSGLVFAPVQAADPIALSIGGYFAAGFGGNVSEARDGIGTDRPTAQAGNGKRGHAFFVDSEVHLKGQMTLEDVLGQGPMDVRARVELDIVEENEDRDGDHGSEILDEAWIEFRTGVGAFRFGFDDPISERFATTAPSALGPFGVNSPDFVMSNAADSNRGGFGTNSTISTGARDAMKVIVMTPEFDGFQVGASYAPDAESGTTGQQSGTGSVSDSGGPEWSLAVSYLEAFGPVAVNASAGIVHQNLDAPLGLTDGTGASVDQRSPMSWSAGIQAAYLGFEFGGSYRAGYNVNGVADQEDSVYDLGILWKIGPIKVSLNGSQGFYTRQTTTANNVLIERAGSGSGILTSVGLGAEYALGPGMEVNGAVRWDNWNDEQADAVTSGSQAPNNADYHALGAGIAATVRF